MQKHNAKVRLGLRWSPHPVKHYMAAVPAGSVMTTFMSAFATNPAVWNLFWISAPEMEEVPFSDAQASSLFVAANATAVQLLAGESVSKWAVSLMPKDFADLVESHPEQSRKLALSKLIGPEWGWLLRERGQLFYEARTGDSDLPVPVPEMQNETSAEDSANIVSLSKFRGNPRGV